MRKYTLLILFVFLVIPAYTALADPADDLRAQIKEKEAQIAALEKEIKEFQGSLEKQAVLSRTLRNEVAKLETQIKRLNSDIRLTEAHIDKTNLRISELTNEIDVRTGDIEDGKIILAGLIKSVDEHDDISLVEALISYPTLSDFLNEREYTLRLNEELDNEIRKQQQRKTELEEERIKREKEEGDYQAYRRDLSNKKSIQESITGEKSQLLRESKSQESEFQKLVHEREKKQRLIQDELIGIEEELRRQIDPSSLPQEINGILGWPTEKPEITQGFGFTQFATTYGSDIYKGKGHNGIDFRAAMGTRILASADGIVKDFGDTDPICKGGSYGKWVLIEHPNNLMTIYGHLSQVLVQRGQAVRRGDTIAYSGATGYVTGPHLHFTVYASNTYKLAKTNHCGMVPAGGYLNPLVYLPHVL